jgi:hypothetical protein
MRPVYAILAILFIVSAAARAQVVPAVNGPPGLQDSGTLKYDLRYSQTAQFYATSADDTQSSAVSGELIYANLNAARPFSLTYSGGDLWNIVGPSTGTGIFQHLFVSQGIFGRRWSLNLSDNVSYLPQAPTTGFSGIPGVGGLPGLPGQTSQPILTQNTRSVNNTVSPSFTHSLNHATSLSFSGSYGVLRFPNGDGLDTNQWQVGPQVTRRLNALNSISGQYSFSHFSYPDYTITMEIQSAQLGYQRTWNRRLKTSVSAGPEWIHGVNSLGIPSSMDLTVSAGATYDARFTSCTLSYFRAASGGAGVSTQIGVHYDDVSAGLTRQLGRSLSVSATGSYIRTEGLQLPGVTNGKFGGVAATQRLSQSIIVYANYTAIQQSSSSALPTNAISGLSQVIGFGIGYSPREMHFKK